MRADPKPPFLFHRFFRWFCKPKLRGYIEGDLLQLYAERVKTKGKSKADWLFIADVILLLRPAIIRTMKTTQRKNQSAMMTNYITIAWRNMRRNRITSLIKIAGLCIAVSSVLFIGLYIRDEMEYDLFFPEADHIFQVNMTVTDKGLTSPTGGNTGPAVTPTMLAMYPEIESYARVYRPGDVLVRYEESNRVLNSFTESRVWGVDSNFLEIFGYRFVQGNARTCLAQPGSVVITESVARKYFGQQSAVGKMLLLNAGKKPFLVSAVLQDLPAQSTFQFDFLVPIHTYAEVKKRSWNWFWLQVNSYVKLKSSVVPDQVSLARLENKFAEMVKLHAFNEKYGQSYDNYVKNGGRLEFSLMPFSSLHLHALPAGVPARLTTLNDIKYIYIFSSVGVFIVLLACINFMNLATAHAAVRAKEVGIRKVLGSGKKQLIHQFLTEALLYSLLACVLGLVLTVCLLPAFNTIAGKAVYTGSLFSATTMLLLLGLCLVTGILAGVYPAFYLTSFNPVQVLKGMRIFKNNFTTQFIRNGLVVFQFTVSIVMIICTLVVFRQLKYSRNKDMGLYKSHVIEIANTSRLGANEEAFRKELIKLPGVAQASCSGSIPTKNSFGDTYSPASTENDNTLIRDIDLSSYMVDEHFITTLGIKLLKGRNFSAGFNDSATVILNETAALQIGWKDPIGKWLDYPGNDQQFKVIGVVKDFNTSSLRDAVVPFALFHISSATYYVNSSFVSVQVIPGNLSFTLSRIENTWKKFAPAMPFDYSFLEEEYDTLYRAEQQMGKIFRLVTGLSLFVACLGLFGLSLFTAARRRKEIGIRKVVGASVPVIVYLLSRHFLKLIVLSALIACPVGWFAMHRWLQSFAYRVTIDWEVFAVAVSSALSIGLLVTGFQSVKAATADPVNSLRTE